MRVRCRNRRATPITKGIRFNELLDTNLALENFTHLINGDVNIGVTAGSNAPDGQTPRG